MGTVQNCAARAWINFGTYFTFTISIILIMGTASWALEKEREKEKVISSFEDLIYRVKEKLANKIIVYGDESIKKYLLIQIIEVEDVDYDIQETKSLISPYVATMTIHFSGVTNSPGGRGVHPDTGFLMARGFQSKERALKANGADDFWGNRIEPDPEIRANYTFRKGKWLLLMPKEVAVLHHIFLHPENIEVQRILQGLENRVP